MKYMLALGVLLILGACTPQASAPVAEEPTDEPITDEQPNRITNPSFDGDEAWEFYTHDTASSEGEVRSGEYCFDIVSAGNALWHIQLVQSGLGLEAGKRYTTRFDAYADQPLQVRAALEEQGNDFTLLAGEMFDLSTTKTSYEFTAQVDEATDDNRIDLSTGGELISTVPVTACFDNVAVRESN